MGFAVFYHFSYDQVFHFGAHGQSGNESTYCFIVQIKELKEMSLSANQEKSEMKKMEWKIEGDTQKETPEQLRLVLSADLILLLSLVQWKPVPSC